MIAPLITRPTTIRWGPVSELPNEWRARAACLGNDPTLFVEGEDAARGTDETARQEYALAICGYCPVKAHCLAEAVRERNVGVIRGGRIFPPIWRNRGFRA